MNSGKRSILLFETVRVLQFEPENLDFHIRRANASTTNGLRFDMASVVSVPGEGLYRVKVIYDEQGNLVERQCFEYKKREIKSIRLLSSDISYDRKYLNRSAIDSLFARRGDCDEVLVMKNGLVTDTSIANIAIRSKGIWLTPRIPLLKGTARQRMIERHGLQEKDIGISELLKAERIALMNAMTGFYELENLRIETE